VEAFPCVEAEEEVFVAAEEVFVGTEGEAFVETEEEVFVETEGAFEKLMSFLLIMKLIFHHISSSSNSSSNSRKLVTFQSIQILDAVFLEAAVDTVEVSEEAIVEEVQVLLVVVVVEITIPQTTQAVEEVEADTVEGAKTPSENHLNLITIIIMQVLTNNKIK
jgi:hypothetical protein